MSCEQDREITVFLCIVIVVFSNFRTCSLVSVGKLNDLDGFTAYQGNADEWETVNPKQDAKQGSLGGRVFFPLNSQPTSSYQEHSVHLTAIPVPSLINSLSKPDQIGDILVQKGTHLGAPWNFGHISVQKRSLDFNSKYQADLNGKCLFHCCLRNTIFSG